LYLVVLGLAVLTNSSQSSTTIARAPSTGAAPSQSLIVDSNHQLWLVDGQTKQRRNIGTQVPVPDPKLAAHIPQQRAVTMFKALKLENADLRIAVTTGLRPDPGTTDEVTGRPLYGRSDDIDVFCASCSGYPKLLHRSYEEIDDVKLADLSRTNKPFIAVFITEGMHTSTIRLFRLTSSNHLAEVSLPDSGISGRQRDSIETAKDGHPVLSTEIKEFGNFENAPTGSIARVTELRYRWNPKKTRFEVADKETHYSTN
jgi:hypothetical protein